MQLTKQTPRRSWIAYTKEEERELGLKIKKGFQVWHNMYHDALCLLLRRGVELERAVRFVLSPRGVGAFRRACLLTRGARRRAA